MSVAVLDIGTSAAKAAVVDADGSLLAAGSAGYPTVNPGPGRVEQDPDDWWSAARAALDACGSEARRGVEALGVTGQMQDLVPLGEGGSLGRALLYSDQRAVSEHVVLTTALGATWGEAAGAEPDATSVAAKWLWLARHDAPLTAAARRVLLGAHSYVVWRATGIAACDPTSAATTGLYDVRTGGWWEPVLDAAGLPGALLPEVRRADEVTGALLDAPAAQLGLPAGIPVVHAAGDALCTTLGVVGDAVGRPYAYLGTSGWVGLIADGDVTEVPGVISLPGLRAGQHLSVAPLLSCGFAFDWARAALLGGVEPRELDALAASACAAAEGLVFLPHLDGSRAPHPDPNAAGVLVGLRRGTGRAALAAAVVEGVAHALRAIAARVAPGAPELSACGGAASPVVVQALADVLGVPVRSVPEAHAAALGAATCTLVALGHRAPPPPAAVATAVPDPARSAAQRRAAPVVDALAPALAGAFARLAPRP